MKTLKTISSAFVVALLVSTVSAPAVGSLGLTWKDYVSFPFVLAKNAAVSVAKATDTAVFGNSDVVGSGLPVFRSYLKPEHGYARAAVLAAIAATPYAAYKLYNYLTAEEAPVVDEGEAVEKGNQEAPKADEPVVAAPTVDEPVVDAPKVEAKSARKPMGARRMAKAPKAKVSAQRKAKRAGSEQRTAKRNAGYKNGKNGCNVRRGK